jgi:hypothetical protein
VNADIELSYLSWSEPQVILTLSGWVAGILNDYVRGKTNICRYLTNGRARRNAEHTLGRFIVGGARNEAVAALFDNLPNVRCMVIGYLCPAGRIPSEPEIYHSLDVLQRSLYKTFKDIRELVIPTTDLNRASLRRLDERQRLKRLGIRTRFSDYLGPKVKHRARAEPSQRQLKRMARQAQYESKRHFAGKKKW